MKILLLCVFIDILRPNYAAYQWPKFQCFKLENTFTIQEMCDGRDNCEDSSDECATLCAQTFKCHSDGKCLALDKFCNGVADCADGSDEERLNTTKAANTDKGFMCQNLWTGDEVRDQYRRRGTNSLAGSQPHTGSCLLPSELTCDGINHCGDHSDECAAGCDVSAYFLCRNGRCIAARHRCDGVDDCGDDSDECPGCPSSFECDDGSCIPQSKFCDGVVDCRDGSDEKKMTSLNVTSSTVVCTSAFNYAADECVVPSKYICDGSEQCLYREDECVPGCDSYSFICGNGRCIVRTHACNGRDDCGDMSDECAADCPTTFTCENGDCISVDKFCDGRVDCSDGSDEIATFPEGDELFVNDADGFYCANPMERKQHALCRIPPKYICDGATNCLERRDECERGCHHSFFCDDGETCIERINVCDGLVQCRDGKDETKTSAAWANLRGFKCYTTRFEQSIPCILPQEMVNDTVADCERDTDLCHAHYNNQSDSRCWTCISRPDVTISIRQLCDGQFDCPDLSDECLCQDVQAINVCRNLRVGGSVSSNYPCQPGSVPCLRPDETPPKHVKPGCITMDKFCDGSIDCFNHADEVSCGKSNVCASLPSTTSPNDIKKHRHKRDRCTPNHICSKHDEANIWTPKYAVACDGRPECFDLEDECGAACVPQPVFCEERNNDGFFACPEGGIKPGRKVCDGVADCPRSGQDEVGCPGRFYCSKGRITSVEDSRRCDFTSDCDDSSDEMGCFSSHFYCEEGEVLFVPKRQKFDGKKDCADGSDECPKNSFDHSIFSSREHLIDNLFLNVMVWVMGLLSVIGNSFVIVNSVRGFANKSQRFNNIAAIFNFLVFNLAIADLMMGVFLIALGCQNVLMSGKYCREDKRWRSGHTCKVFGVLATISSEASICILAILSSYRLFCVLQPVKGRTLRVRSAAVLTTITWLATTTIALLPILPALADYFVTSVWLAPNPFFLSDVVERPNMETFTMISRAYLNSNNVTSQSDSLSWKTMSREFMQINSKYTTLGYFGYYSKHAVCLPKIFVTHNETAWEYSAGLTVFNFLMFVYIVMAYVRISRPSQIQAKRKSSNCTTKNMQRRIAMLVATDFACWMPTCMIGFVQLAGVPVPGTVYALAAIILLPINSALNPILYSNAFQGAFTKLLMCISWIKNKFRKQCPSLTRRISSPKCDHRVEVGLMATAISELTPNTDLAKRKKRCFQRLASNSSDEDNML